MDATHSTPDGSGTPSEEPKVVEPVFPASEEIDPRIKELVGEEHFAKEAQPKPKPEDKKPAAESVKTEEAPKPDTTVPERKEGEEPEKKDGEEPKEAPKPDTTVPERKEGEEPEKKDGEEPKEAPKADPIPEPSKEPQVYRTDKRIAQLIRDIRMLKGDDSAVDIDIEAYAKEVARYPYAEREKMLKELLAEQRALKHPDSKGPASLSEDDLDAIVEARAAEKLREQQENSRIEDFDRDFRETYEAHEELQEGNPKYDAKVAEAVAVMVNGGMKLSKAYETVTGFKATSEAKAADDAAKKAEEERNKALSGAMSGSETIDGPKSLSWEEMDRISKEDPVRYRKMVAEGQVPE
ncbi:MAG: hypothetical protein HGA33_00795 [Candidatus Moranbacteria bacterium]|nr:hypothetical protein [Candidatus Moranbacteria bacterium]